MDISQILLAVFGVVVFIVLPVVAVIGAIMVELAKAKRSGIDVESIVRDARRRAYERGRRED